MRGAVVRSRSSTSRRISSIESNIPARTLAWQATVAAALPNGSSTRCSFSSFWMEIPPAAVAATDFRKINASLKAMAKGLGDKPFCSGIHLSLSDIAVGCALGWLEFRFPEIGWRAEYPNLAKLMDKLAQRASFADTKPA